MTDTMVRRFVRAAGVMVATAGLGLGGLTTFAQPAMAHCYVNTGDCYGHCEVNTGDCYGHCAVNTGYCGPNGGCLVNTGNCYSAYSYASDLCTMASTTDPTVEGSVQTGTLSGAYTDVDNPTGSVSLKCTLQIWSPSHSGADAVSATGSGTGTAILPPTQISYVAPEGSDVYVCAERSVNGTTSYWDATNGAWSSSNAVDCDLAISQSTSNSVGEAVHSLLP